jgi:lactoylglutathione lyase
MTISLRHDHVGITLSPDHLDATIAWYVEKLDFVLIRQFSAHGSVFTFIANGGAKIELISAGAETRNPIPASMPASHDVERLHHVCVAVDDLDDTLTQLHARGVIPFAGPMYIEAIEQRIAFVLDNVGTIIELTAAA